jgi:hypothetical protein
MGPGTFNSAYRTALAIVLVSVIWMIIPWARSYVDLVAGGARRGAPGAMPGQRMPQPQQKLSAPELEALFSKMNGLEPDSQIRCTASRDWDYVCSYLPTALPSPRRLHFGVIVDAKRWVKVSPILPVGTPLPRPE